MKIFFIGLIMIILTDQALHGQVINIEAERIKTDTTGWAGSAEIGTHIYKNNFVLYDISSNIHVQYKTKKSLFLLLNNISFISVDNPGSEDTPFENAGFQHFRYNYKITDKFVWEAFVQGQYNEALGIDWRFLTGTGPRYKVIGQDKFRLYVAALYMFEREKNPEFTDAINVNRMSSYVSFTIAPNDKFNLVSTTYYQPALSDFSDYRISSVTNLKIYLSKRFYWKSDYNILFDTAPAEGIDATVYSFNNGVGLEF
jgi:hypothetical protein